jgi:hypothetical protein
MPSLSQEEQGHPDMPMRIRTRITLILPVIVLFAFLYVSGCAGVRGTFSVGIGIGEGTAKVSARELGPFEDGSTVRLEPVHYVGDVEIRADDVTLIGYGPGVTEISGDIRLYGDGCTLKDLSVAGDIYIYGTESDLSAAYVGGNIKSKGKSNKR